ncbi:nicotinate-nucleotide adenylyltransferase [Nitrosomonas marina]|uniref:Probable nicotinate-nucleotide adenylyltransferase n=1 Tax=Nitrosomonas marina TaxID=917 RepID=A0A1H8B0R5_9PROT|nr:nicotinate-nucleotide adenylyltransferase [Nitrosomonas marina]SEM75714.1 nicotinate-nucleotide adenylyltransferase [Nitrosomonas marina]
MYADLSCSSGRPTERPVLIGIYGGTFDPLHYGHLRVAEELIDTICFDQFFFVPAGEPRLRDSPGASKHHRVQMVSLSIQNNIRFSMDDRETKRSGVSTTVSTLQEYHQEYDGKAVLCFVIGADAFVKIHCWHQWRKLFQLCHLIIVERPGCIRVSDSSQLPQKILSECASRWTTDSRDLVRHFNGMIYTANTTLLDISATQIRSLVKAGKSIRYLLPDITLDYIKTHNLYSGKNEFR